MNYTKKKWEDWQFSFYLKNTTWTLVDLNWYKYSIVVEKNKWPEVLRESWEITISAQELIKTIPASTTKDFATWQYSIEYRMENPSWNIFITDKVIFDCVNTLHFN